MREAPPWSDCIPVSDLSRGIEVYAKCEGLNPTGSFKDRGMTVAVTMAAVRGQSRHHLRIDGQYFRFGCGLCGTRRPFGIRGDSGGKIALGKLAQAMMHGARVIQIDGNFDTGMSIVKDMAETCTGHACQFCESLPITRAKNRRFRDHRRTWPSAPDYHFLPVGNAGNISAYWMGYTEYSRCGNSF